VYKPDTDKRSRVIAQIDLFAGGSVRFPRRAAWLEDFTAELLAFPGCHDDQVDALTQGLAWGRVKRGSVSWGSSKGLTESAVSRYRTTEINSKPMAVYVGDSSLGARVPFEPIPPPARLMS
jgi:hypothetical protein